MNRQFLTSTDLMKILKIKRPTAYKIIQNLNRELREKGYYTTSGRVSAKYFNERFGIERG